MLGKTILIVDDDAAVRKTLLFILDSQNYRVVQAVDGEDGYQKAVDCRPDLILSDLMMPKANGIQFYRRIRSRVDFRDIPFVFLTSVDDPRLRDMGRAIGVTDYLNKPIRGARLLEVVGGLINAGRKTDMMALENAIADFRVDCPFCSKSYTFHEATWCDCPHPIPTKVCPFCFRCLCGQPADFKKAFWNRLSPEFIKGITRVGGRS